MSGRFFLASFVRRGCIQYDTGGVYPATITTPPDVPLILGKPSSYTDYFRSSAKSQSHSFECIHVGNTGCYCSRTKSCARMHRKGCFLGGVPKGHPIQYLGVFYRGAPPGSLQTQKACSPGRLILIQLKPPCKNQDYVKSLESI